MSLTISEFQALAESFIKEHQEIKRNQIDMTQESVYYHIPTADGYISIGLRYIEQGLPQELPTDLHQANVAFKQSKRLHDPLGKISYARKASSSSMDPPINEQSIYAVIELDLEREVVTDFEVRNKNFEHYFKSPSENLKQGVKGFFESVYRLISENKR